MDSERVFRETRYAQRRVVSEDWRADRPVCNTGAPASAGPQAAPGAGQRVLIGPLFIHNLSLAALLGKIRVVAQYRIRENKPLLHELERTLRAIDAIREERNLLIHGEWQIKDTETFPVKVRDFRMRYDGSDWQEFTETALTEKKITRLVRRLKGLGNDVDHLIEELGNSQTAPKMAGEAS